MKSLSLILVFLVASVLQAEGYFDPHCDGKQVIVHLFEWKWTDIAAECERFLGPNKYCGVQISPPNEHTIITTDYMRPWWERYQPISYKLRSRSGTEAQLRDMIRRCNKVGVRIYVDAVINHMAGLQRKGRGTAGTPFDTDTYDFTAVPFSKKHFHSYCPVNNYGDYKNVRDCFLVGLCDLDHSQEYVKDKVAGYLNSLVDAGVAGFRVDASKHMWPEHLKDIQGRVHDLATSHGFPAGARPFFYHEVIDRNDGAVKVSEYYDLGLVTEFRFSQKIAWGSAGFHELNNVVDYGWFMARSDRAFVFVDNHDNQRGHGGAGDTVTHRHPVQYKLAVGFMLAYNYGFTRVMSSYKFPENDGSQGPPHNADYSAKDVIINADGLCANDWVCEHRWPAIKSMVGFRNAVTGTKVLNWYNAGDVVAFSRGNKGFFLMAKNGFVDQSFVTGLAQGSYCDVIANCQRKINVGADGKAHITIYDAENPLVAIYVGAEGNPVEGTTSSPGITVPVTKAPTSRSTSNSAKPTVTTSKLTSKATKISTTSLSTKVPTSPTPAPTTTETPGYRRTQVFMQLQTVVGQNLFFRGGGPQDQPIPIKHRKQGDGPHFDLHNRLRSQDTTLDWGTSSPAVWTSNLGGSPGYTPQNSFGEHYWLMDVDMDCSKTQAGWFEIKGFMNGWENDATGTPCSGSASLGAPAQSSKNHWARCGYVNVFRFNSHECIIESLP